MLPDASIGNFSDILHIKFKVIEENSEFFSISIFHGINAKHIREKNEQS